MRKAIYQSSEEEGRALFKRAPSVHFATTGEDGHPILRVVHTVLDGEDLIAFHGAPAGEKMEGIGRRAVMSFHEVVAEIPSWFIDPELACPATTYYVSAQAEGVLEEVHDLETKARVLQTMMGKYQPEGRHIPIRGDDPHYTKAVKGLLVAGLRIEKPIACKAKLGQNRTTKQRIGVIESLWKRGQPGDVNAVDLLTRRFPELTPPFLRAQPGLRFDVRVGEDDEMDEVLALLEEAYWLAGIAHEKRRAAIRASSESTNGAVVLARDETTGELVAFARAVSDGRVAWIYDVMVREADRRSGTGVAVMRLLLDHPAVRNALVVRLGTRDAMPFYERLGFLELDKAPRNRSWRSTEMIQIRTFPRDQAHQSLIQEAAPE